MACDIIYDETDGVACFYCNTTDQAFGPIVTKYHAPEGADLREVMFEFMDANGDPRVIESTELTRSLWTWFADLKPKPPTGARR